MWSPWPQHPSKRTLQSATGASAKVHKRPSRLVPGVHAKYGLCRSVPAERVRPGVSRITRLQLTLIRHFAG